jgi:hypothetical protein
LAIENQIGDEAPPQDPCILRMVIEVIPNSGFYTEFIPEAD